MTERQYDALMTTTNCELHNREGCSICFKLPGRCTYGACTRKAVAEVECYGTHGRLVEVRPACRKHNGYGTLKVGYGTPA